MAGGYDKKYNGRNALRSRSRVNLKVRNRSSGARISLERESRKWNGKFSLNGEGEGGKNSMFSFLGDYIAEGDCIDRRLQESLTIVAQLVRIQFRI